MADVARPSPSVGQMLALLLPLGLAGVLLSFSLGLHVRADLWDALRSWRYLAKFGVTGSIALAGFHLMLRLAGPEHVSLRSLMWLPTALMPLCLAVATEMTALPLEDWETRAIGFTPLSCLGLVVVISLMPLAAGLAARRRGAPRSPTLAGAMAGFAAGGSGTFFYALHCLDDSPFYVVLWYGGGIALLMLLGGVTGRYMLRW